VPQIEVTFDIDANGILSVTAKDKGSGKEQSITITGASTLPSEEVERMIRDSEQSASADKEKRERVDLKNQADSLCYQSEKQLTELGDKVSEAEKQRTTELITKLRNSIQSESYEEIKSLMKQIQDSLMEIGKRVYGNPPSKTEVPKNQQDSVIDADFSETK